MPIDLDAVSKKRNTFKKEPITQVEKNRRIKNNLYLYYSKPGYVANNCFAKKGNEKKPFDKAKKQFNIAKPAKVTQVELASNLRDSKYNSILQTECYNDSCLTHKAAKELNCCYLNQLKERRISKVKQRLKTLIPTNYTLYCVDGLKAEVVTIDNRKIIINSYTNLFVYIIIHYYKVLQYNKGCEYYSDIVLYAHVQYEPDISRNNTPAFIRLIKCYRIECSYYNKEEDYIH